jgi:hypothetical protein
MLLGQPERDWPTDAALANCVGQFPTGVGVELAAVAPTSRVTPLSLGKMPNTFGRVFISAFSRSSRLAGGSAAQDSARSCLF